MAGQYLKMVIFLTLKKSTNENMKIFKCYCLLFEKEKMVKDKYNSKTLSLLLEGGLPRIYCITRKGGSKIVGFRSIRPNSIQ